MTQYIVNSGPLVLSNSEDNLRVDDYEHKCVICNDMKSPDDFFDHVFSINHSRKVVKSLCFNCFSFINSELCIDEKINDVLNKISAMEVQLKAQAIGLQNVYDQFKKYIVDDNG